MPQQVKPALEISLSDLQECIDDAGADEEFLQSNLGRFQIHTDEGGLLVKAEYTKEGHTVKGPSQREYITYTFKDLHHLSRETRQKASEAKREVGGVLKELLQERFADFSNEIFESMRFIDPAYWEDERDFGVKDLTTFIAFFKETLDASGFDAKMIFSEWKSFKTFIKAYFRGYNVRSLWAKVFEFRRQEFPNLCLCAEIVISISGSNSTVERAFSTLRLMLSDKRLPLSHDQMERLLCIYVNDRNWTASEREEIINRSIEIYMEKRRKTRTAAAEEPPKKKKKDEEKDNELIAESGNDENTEEDLNW